MLKYTFLTASIFMLVGCSDGNMSSPEAGSDIQMPALSSKGAVTSNAVYDESWHMTPFWSGEYPDGVSITEEGVVLAARRQAHPDVPVTLECPVDYLGNYHPWNLTRSAAENLEFMTMTKITKVPVISDFVVLVESPDRASKKEYTFKAGDSISYLGYLAEGYGLFKLKGQNVTLPLDEFANDTKWPDDVNMIDQWMTMSCAEKTGYIYLKDLVGLTGVELGLHGISGYGEAADLSEAQAVILRESANP